MNPQITQMTQIRNSVREAKLHKGLRTAAVVSPILLSLAISAGRAVRLDIPDSLTGVHGGTVDIPVLISGQVGQSIISADITICFRETVLTGTTVCRSGNAAPGWTAFANPLPCTVLVAAMGADPLVAGETLLVLRMRVDAIDTTPVRFARCRLNEGQVACTTSSGKFYGRTVGVEETPECEVRATSRLPTIARGTLWLGERPNQAADRDRQTQLLDATGRKVLTLAPGANDVHYLAPGVYFLSSGAPDHCEVRRLVLMR